MSLPVARFRLCRKIKVAFPEHACDMFGNNATDLFGGGRLLCSHKPSSLSEGAFREEPSRKWFLKVCTNDKSSKRKHRHPSNPHLKVSSSSGENNPVNCFRSELSKTWHNWHVFESASLRAESEKGISVCSSSFPQEKCYQGKEGLAKSQRRSRLTRSALFARLVPPLPKSSLRSRMTCLGEVWRDADAFFCLCTNFKK